MGIFSWRRRPQTHIAAILIGDDNPLPTEQRIPVVLRAAEVLQESRRISEIVLVCGADEIAAYYAVTLDYGLDGISQIVAGGGNWKRSVETGVASASRDTAYYLLHDGMRPLITSEMVEHCIDRAMEHGAARAGVLLEEEVRRCTPDGDLATAGEPPGLALLQTPWMIEAGRYRTGNWNGVLSLGGVENIRVSGARERTMAQSMLLFQDDPRREEMLL